MICAKGLLHKDVIPGGVFLAVNLHDPIAGLNTGAGRRGVRRDGCNHRADRLYLLRECIHIKPSDNRYGKNNVHEGSGSHDNEALPARFRLSGTGIEELAFAGWRGELARHFAEHTDIAAKQDGRDAKVGFAPAYSEETRAETNAERLHFDAAGTSCPKVPELMHQDHDPEQNHDPENWS